MKRKNQISFAFVLFEKRKSDFLAKRMIDKVKYTVLAKKIQNLKNEYFHLVQ